MRNSSRKFIGSPPPASLRLKNGNYQELLFKTEGFDSTESALMDEHSFEETGNVDIEESIKDSAGVNPVNLTIYQPTKQDTVHDYPKIVLKVAPKLRPSKSLSPTSISLLANSTPTQDSQMGSDTAISYKGPFSMVNSSDTNTLFQKQEKVTPSIASKDALTPPPKLVTCDSSTSPRAVQVCKL